MAKYYRESRFNPRSPKDARSMRWIIKGIFISLLISLFCTLLLSFLSLMTEATFIDNYMQYTIVAITVFSIFSGSMYAGRQAGARGAFLGGCIGLIYVLLFVLIGMNLNTETISLLIVLNKIAAGIAAGVLGGLIGVNL